MWGVGWWVGLSGWGGHVAFEGLRDPWLAAVGMWVMGQSLKMSSGCDGPEILLSEGGRALRAELWEMPELRGRWRKGRSGRSGQRGRSQDLGAELGEHFRK